MRDYLANVSSAYGAPMGRRDGHPGVEPEGRIYLRRVRLDAGGYDRGGAYWGHGQPLWYYEASDDPAFFGFMRAASRLYACMILEEQHGPLKFYRR